MFYVQIMMVYHHYLYIELLDRYFTRILLDKISLVIFKEHLSAAASEGITSFFVNF